MFDFLKKFNNQLTIGVLSGILLLIIFCFYLFNNIKTISDINKETAVVRALPQALSGIQITFSNERIRIFALERGEISAEQFRNEFNDIEKREDDQFLMLDDVLGSLRNLRYATPAWSKESDVINEKISLINQKRKSLEEALDNLATAYGQNDLALENKAKDEVYTIHAFFNETTTFLAQEAEMVSEQQSIYFQSAVDAALRLLIIFALLILITMGVVNAYVIFFSSRSFSVILNGIKKFDAGDLSYRIPLKSRNEFGVIAAALNIAVDHIQRSQNELEAAKNQLAEKVSELEKFKRLTVGRELKMMELKKEIEKFKKSP